MSLLLQALQKAARSRESSSDEGPPATPEPVQEPSFDFDADDCRSRGGTGQRRADPGR